MKIIIAIDSFKNSATSQALNTAVAKGLKKAEPTAEIQTFQIADGGEGTLLALAEALGGERLSVATTDLLGRAIEADYLLAEGQAFIESATVVGLDLLDEVNEQSFLTATTAGLAPLFLDAKARGARAITLSLGGTGTSDGGLGLLAALQDEDFSGIELTGLADVTNPYFGPTGYAQFFGKQKGGTQRAIALRDKEAEAFAQKIKTEQKIDLQKMSGTGAAGGLGGAIVLLGGKIEPGFDKIAGLIGIEQAIATADLVITGEGRMDRQTANGKVPWGMAKLAQKYEVPTLAICGSLAEELGEMDAVLAGAYSILTEPVSLELALDETRTLKSAEKLAYNLMKSLKIML